MKAIPNKPRTIVLYRTFSANSTGSMTLTGADESVVELTTGIRVRRRFAEFFIPEQYITEDTLPLHVELKVNGVVVKVADLSNARPTDPGDAAIEVNYNDGWPERPTNDANVIVRWLGGTPSTPPTDHVPGMDLWYVPAQEVVDDF